MRHKCLCCLVLSTVLLLTPAVAQDAAARYRGRPIARVMSWRAWRWLVRPERDLWEQPERVLDALRIRSGATVADVGTGVGYFAVRLAHRVGPTGRVYAVDIQPQMLELLQKRLDRFGIRNVVGVLSTPDDPKLPARAVELALLVDVYHEVQRPDRFMANLSRALTPAGRVVLVEYRAEDPTVPIRPEHKMALRQVRLEMEEFGFYLAELYEFLPWQHVMVFRRREPAQEEQFPAVFVPIGRKASAQWWPEAGFQPAMAPVAVSSTRQSELDFEVWMPGEEDGFRLQALDGAGRVAWELIMGPGRQLRLGAPTGAVLRDYSPAARWILAVPDVARRRLTVRLEDGALRVALQGYPLGGVGLAVPSARSLRWKLSGKAELRAAWVRTEVPQRRAAQARTP